MTSFTLPAHQTHLENTVVISRSKRADNGKIVFEYLTKPGQGKNEVARAEGLPEWTSDLGSFIGPNQFELNANIQVYSLNTHPAHEKGIHDALSLHEYSYMVETPRALRAELSRVFADQQVAAKTAGMVVAREAIEGNVRSIQYLTKHGEGPVKELRDNDDRQWSMNLDSSVEVFDNKRHAKEIAEIYDPKAEAVSFEAVAKLQTFDSQGWEKLTTFDQHWGSDMGFDEGFRL